MANGIDRFRTPGIRFLLLLLPDPCPKMMTVNHNEARMHKMHFSVHFLVFVSCNLICFTLFRLVNYFFNFVQKFVYTCIKYIFEIRPL